MGIGSLIHGSRGSFYGPGRHEYSFKKEESESTEDYNKRMDLVRYQSLRVISDWEKLEVPAIDFILTFEATHGYKKEESILSDSDRERWRQAQKSNRNSK